MLMIAGGLGDGNRDRRWDGGGLAMLITVGDVEIAGAW